MKLVAIFVCAFVGSFVLTIAFLNLIAWAFGQVFATIVAWIMLIVGVIVYCVILAAGHEKPQTKAQAEYARQAAGL